MKRLAAFLSVVALAAAFTLFPSSTADAQAPQQSYGVCWARTMCPDGRVIACTVYGNSSAGVACNWYVVPGASVSCNGYVSTPYGWMWQSYYFTCY